jgi:hypothetical protein
MVIATRSGLEEVVSFPGCAPAAAGDGEGNSVTWFARGSLLLDSGDGEGKNSGAAGGGSAGSNAGATAVAMLADPLLTPSSRFQSGGGEETFQIFAGDSSSTPT